MCFIWPLGEPDPERKCKSKRFITKAMFLCALARPRINTITGEMWDGKLEIWPFVKQVAAARSSVNRSRGTLETKPINVQWSVYYEFLIEEAIPAIKELWPAAPFINSAGQREEAENDEACYEDAVIMDKGI